VVTGLAVYWPLALMVKSHNYGGPGGEVNNEMVREAKLIEYFCFSRIPPVSGKAVIPTEWEKALGITIKLRDGAGEVVSLVPELVQHVQTVSTLVAGQSVFVRSTSEKKSFSLIYRLSTPGQQFLYLSKSLRNLKDAPVQVRYPLWLIALGLGIAGSLIITIGVVLISNQQTGRKSD